MPREQNVVAINVGHKHMLETHYEAVARGGHNSCTTIYSNIDVFNYFSVRGENNEMQSGNFNAILGGSDNVINGFNYVGMFGHGVTAVRDEAFHANNYLIKDIPITSTIIGQLIYNPSTFGVNIR